MTSVAAFMATYSSGPSSPGKRWVSYPIDADEPNRCDRERIMRLADGDEVLVREPDGKVSRAKVLGGRGLSIGFVLLGTSIEIEPGAVFT